MGAICFFSVVRNGSNLSQVELISAGTKNLRSASTDMIFRRYFELSWEDKIETSLKV